VEVFPVSAPVLPTAARTALKAGPESVAQERGQGNRFEQARQRGLPLPAGRRQNIARRNSTRRRGNSAKNTAPAARTTNARKPSMLSA